MFGGFGPLIMGIIYAVIQHGDKDFSLSGSEVLTAVTTTYLIAFIQAGASVLNRIETRRPMLMTGLHLLILYVAYVGAYLLNRWIPFSPYALGIFTAVFIIGYFAVWIIVYICVKAASKSLNKKLTK